jgi:hypothetical protein
MAVLRRSDLSLQDRLFAGSPTFQKRDVGLVGLGLLINYVAGMSLFDLIVLGFG